MSELAASGRFLLRIAPGLHAALRAAARAQGLSLNEHCQRLLSTARASEVPALDQAVRWALEAFGEGLVGLAAFGSWARGSAATGSDVDLLFVLEDTLALTRQLYRTPGLAELKAGERILEAQFVHLPAAGTVPGGLWAEITLDGIVLFERGFRLSRRLAGIRHDIADGRLVRRTAHGQPYWTRNEAA